MSLWGLDQQIFRAVHEGWRNAALDPLLITATDMGLGQIQAAGLLLAALRPRVGAAAYLGLAGLFAAVAFFTGGGLLALIAFSIVAVLFWGLTPTAAWCALAAAASAGIVRLLIVPLVDRQRPSNFIFARPLEDVFGMTSFPSGHATTSFAIAVAIAWAMRGSGRPGLIAAVIAWAALIGVSRIYVGVHYPLDILGGLGMGLVFGTLAALWFERKGWLRQASTDSSTAVS